MHNIVVFAIFLGSSLAAIWLVAPATRNDGWTMGGFCIAAGYILCSFVAALVLAVNHLA